METRTCKVCGVEKPFARGTWVINKGRPVGRVCYSCSKAAAVQRYANDAEMAQRAQLRSKEYHNANKQRPEYQAKVAEKNARWAKANKERVNAKTRAWREDPSNLAKKNAASARWAECNRARRNAIGAKRRATKLLRTPGWLTPADLVLIDAKYAMAKWLSEVVGVSYHVDHVVPLNGAIVSGLHVPDNLAIIRATDNMSKHNKWVP